MMFASDWLSFVMKISNELYFSSHVDRKKLSRIRKTQIHTRIESDG